jgi:hypothetical protein
MKYFALFIFLAAITSACTKGELDNIKFRPPGKAYELVVEGGINTFQQTQYIRLSLPNFDITGTFEPARGAKVFVNDGQRNIEFKETATPGIYSGTVLRNANYNKAYKLTVSYNNKEYRAGDTLRQVVNLIDDFLPLGAIKLSDGNIHLTIPKHTFGFLNSCKWLIAYPGSSLWNPAKFDGTLNYSYTHTQGSPNSIYPLINQTRSTDVQPNDFISIYKFSMSDEYARYLYSVFQETDWKGIFSNVPGEIKGNISDGAVGFFYVMDVDLRKYRAKDLVK